MSDPGPWSPAVPVVAGNLLGSLNLAAATAAEEEHGPSSGMLTSAERGLLSALVARTYLGAGAIVDGGSFLGSSLLAEARGLRSNPALAELDLAAFPNGRPIHGYELGHHPAPSNPAAAASRTYGADEYALGESFVPLLEANIAAHRELIELHIGDLTTMAWGGAPVEIAFIDVCKTPELNAHVSREFYPALVPGGSTLVHQDFFFDMLPWIRVTMGYLAEFFTWEGQVASSSVFRPVTAVPPRVAAHDPYLDDTLEKCLAYHDALAFPGIDRATQLRLALSRVQLILRKGSPAVALEELRTVALEYVDIVGATSPDDSHTPAPGTPGSAQPRYRLDRTITQVFSRLTAQATSNDTPARKPGAVATDGVVQARSALAQRDFATARALLQPLRAAEGRAGVATLLLARTEFESGQLEMAAAMLDELLAGRPRQARARALRARVHLLAGDRAAARDEAQLALEHSPHLVAAHRVLFDVDVGDRLDMREPGPGAGAGA